MLGFLILLAFKIEEGGQGGGGGGFLTFQLYSEKTKKIKIVSIILKKCLKGFFSASKVCLLKVSSDSSEFKGMCTPKIDKLILWGP